MNKISVIMPCLNVANFIEECMTSVVGQSLREMEILVVDAGSTDGTLEILDKFVNLDERIRIIHSDKKSYGYQMNLGISEATGEYIGIVETDDMIRADMMETLYLIAKQEDADYVKGTARGFYPKEGDIEWEDLIIPCNELRSQDKVILNPSEHPILFDSDNFLWNGIYNAEYLKKIKFHETPGAAFQDISALFRIISGATKAVYINHLVYDYRHNNLNASSYSRKCFQYAATEYKYIQSFMQGLSEEWTTRYYLKLVALSFDRMLVMASTGEYWEEANEGIKELQRLIDEGISAGRISWEDYSEEQAEFGKLFLVNPQELYEQYALQFANEKRVLRHLVENLEDKSFYIFGAAARGKFLHMYLAINGVTGMQGYCDNSPNVQGMSVQSKIVYKPKNIQDIGEKYFVVAVKNHFEDIKGQLMFMGVPEKNIVHYGGGANRLLFVNH